MSTHTNINMSTAVSNFAADLNSEPFPFPNTDTSIKSLSCSCRSVKSGCFLLKRPLPILVWGKIVLLNSPRRMAASSLCS